MPTHSGAEISDNRRTDSTRFARFVDNQHVVRMATENFAHDILGAAWLVAVGRRVDKQRVQTITSSIETDHTDSAKRLQTAMVQVHREPRRLNAS